ncbi:MAG: hypothetical protein DWQ53_21300 [Microcystis flos-aquae DF17]|nr:MAG: hypothetical protein DWQ53_21300 [Microcystis flos-aquae DF17]
MGVGVLVQFPHLPTSPLPHPTSPLPHTPHPTPHTPHPTPHFPTSPTIVKKCYNYAVITAYHLDRRERQWL